MRPRVAIVAYSQETSSFTTQRTTLDTFRAYGLAEGPAVLENRFNHEIGGFLHELQAAGFEWEPCPVIHATAGAHGPLTAATRAWFEERIVAGIRAVAPLDAVYLALHGAAAADDEPDTEGRLQELVREAVGPGTPIVLSLDHHANLTQRMVDGCDALVAHRTQPHAMRDTGQLAARLLMPILRGELQPTIAWRKIPLITHQEQFLTAAGPMKTWFDRARAMERLPGVASASTFPMQPWLDIPEGGWACAVVTDGDRELAERLAGELADLAWELRDAFLRQESISPAEAVAQAIAADRGLVVLSDTGDSVWGGAAGDSTALLAELLRQRPSQMALVPMVDPVMAEQSRPRRCRRVGARAARPRAGSPIRAPCGDRRGGGGGERRPHRGSGAGVDVLRHGHRLPAAQRLHLRRRQRAHRHRRQPPGGVRALRPGRGGRQDRRGEDGQQLAVLPPLDLPGNPSGHSGPHPVGTARARLETPAAPDLSPGPTAETFMTPNPLRRNEDAMDAAIMKRVLEDPDQELVPFTLVKRIADGEHPVRVWREYRGLRAGELATAAGIASSYLSDIENGKKPGSVNAMKCIAIALDVTIDDLI